MSNLTQWISEKHKRDVTESSQPVTGDVPDVPDLTIGRMNHSITQPAPSAIVPTLSTPHDRRERILDSPHTHPCFIQTQTKKTMDYRSFRIREKKSRRREGEEKSSANLVPRVSVVNGHMTGIVLGVNQSAGVGSC